MEPSQPVFDTTALTPLATEIACVPSPPKRLKLSHEDPTSTTSGATPSASHNAATDLQGHVLTKAQVDYWRWKYEEVSRSLAVSMPPGLLESAPNASGSSISQSHGTWGRHQRINDDLELAYEINVEMGMIPGARSREQGGARGSQRDHGTDSLESTPSSHSDEGCGVTQRDMLPRSPSTSVAGSVFGGNDPNAVLEGLHDLGISLQRRAREQLDLLQMPPPG